MPMRDSGALTLKEAQELNTFAQAVRTGLRHPIQKELPSQYLYDEVGSALYEAITVLPEYGLTRASERLLRQHAHSIVTQLPPPITVAELGCGTGRKTRWLLEALAQREPITYFPIDISASALALCAQHLGALDAVSVEGVEGQYLDGLEKAHRQRRVGETLLVLFLGSTIGNFLPPAEEHFLRDVRAHLQPGDALLLGTDLQKSISVLESAYDDPVGVTAAFNRNILARINRELGGTFDLGAFTHRAGYDDQAHRIDMHLCSTKEQTVHIPGAHLKVSFQPGESIWTECSHKFRVEDLPPLAHRTGFQSVGQWVDREWAFAQNLWLAV